MDVRNCAAECVYSRKSVEKLNNLKSQTKQNIVFVCRNLLLIENLFANRIHGQNIATIVIDDNTIVDGTPVERC